MSQELKDILVACLIALLTVILNELRAMARHNRTIEQIRRENGHKKEDNDDARSD